MNKITFCLLFLAFSLFAFSQDSNDTPIFRVSLKDLKMTAYPKDTTANALVLYEYGKSFVNPHDYDLETEIKRKIKIFNKEGFNNANVTIHLYIKDSNTQEFVNDITATTYNLENNKVVTSKLDKKNIYTEKYDENHTLVKFSLPKVKSGSVITYSYTKISPFMFNYKGWDFQGDIPKLYSEYNTSIPANWEYSIKLIGGKKLAINETKTKEACLTGGNGGVANCFEARYAMKDMPAFIEEDFMTSKSNYLARIEYELKTFNRFNGTKVDYTRTWETADKDLKKEKSIGRQLSKSIKVEDILPPTILNEKDLLKKTKSIYKFVQDHYVWNGELRIFNDVSVKDLIKNKTGNATALNILLKIFLEETGIKAIPVLISTRNNGFATKLFPVISEFNYLIVQATIDNKSYLLDATDPYLCFGELPFRCLNMYGRLLDFENGSQWIDIAPEKPSNVFYKADLSIDAEQNVSGQINAKYSGYHALSTKKRYFSNKETYIEKLKNNAPFLDISNHEALSKEKDSPTFSEKYQVKYNLDNTGENIYLNPILTKFFSSNPFKLQERTYPIDFGYKDTFIYMFSLKFNDDYSIVEMPKDFISVLPNNTGTLSLSTKQVGNSIHLVMKFNFKEAIYAPEYYPYLKKFMAKIIDTQNNSLILLKPNT